VLTFDRRGERESTGAPSRGDFRRQALDALALLEALQKPRVGLWGFSQGGWVAPLAASMSADVAFLVLVASTGVTPAAQMRYATEQQLARHGYGDEVIDRALALRGELEGWIHDPQPSLGSQLQANLASAYREPWWDLAFLPSELPDADARRAWIAEMDFDPLPIFRQVRVPTLLFYGTDDAWSPVPASVEAWREARGDRVDIVLVEGASHEMTMPDGSLAPVYSQALLRWLRSHELTGA
jgi:pimeloyl-ACP methyl ester carboxylesterase